MRIGRLEEKDYPVPVQEVVVSSVIIVIDFFFWFISFFCFVFLMCLIVGGGKHIYSLRGLMDMYGKNSYNFTHSSSSNVISININLDDVCSDHSLKRGVCIQTLMVKFLRLSVFVFVHLVMLTTRYNYFFVHFCSIF